ncbi:MAG: hypothetical protein OES57_02300 [Acidimicrobiia bacterium]|nr:hypothetical protein [Acidimicrobiia bacterium]
MRWIHPRDRKLREWLETGEPNSVDEHVVTCSRCATRLEEMEAPGPELGEALQVSMRAPDDLVQRLGVRMTESMRNRQDLRMFLELMGISWPTVRSLMTEDES